MIRIAFILGSTFYLSYGLIKKSHSIRYKFANLVPDKSIIQPLFCEPIVRAKNAGSIRNITSADEPIRTEKAEIADLQNEIKDIILQIQKVNEEIKKVGDDVDKALQKVQVPDDLGRPFWNVILLRLMDEKQSLRDEKQSLRDKEQSLSAGNYIFNNHFIGNLFGRALA